MFNLVTTARPVMPGKDAYILFQRQGGFSEFPLAKNSPINIQMENSEEKFCTGWYDLKTSTNHPCETAQKIPLQYEDCYHCRAKTGFNPAFYNTTTISRAQEEFNKQPHFVYIAYFGDGIFKVGITAAKRGLKRLYEQGALFYTIVTEAPNATVARNLEARLVSQGLKESVLKNSKSAILQNSLDLTKEYTVFSEFLKTTDYKDSKIESNIETFFFGDYPSEPIKPFTPNQPVSGKVRGVVGRYLILENNERLYGVWLSDYFGKKIKIKAEIIELKRDLQQVSLF